MLVGLLLAAFARGPVEGKGLILLPLVADTLERLGGRAGPRRVYETLVDGDTIIHTDGQTYENGILYEATFNDPGQFAPALGEETLDLHFLVEANEPSPRWRPRPRHSPRRW